MRSPEGSAQKTALLIARCGATLVVLGICVTLLAKEFHRAEMTTVNQLMPASFHYLWQVSLGRERADPGEMRKYLHYYQAVAFVLPKERASAFALSAFCRYYAGNSSRAIQDLHRARKFQPDFFWHNYNLGCIYLKDGRLEDAAGYFRQALAAKPENTIKTMLSSKLYIDHIREAGQMKLSLESLTLNGYDRAFEGLVLCYQKLGRVDELLQTMNRWKQFKAQTSYPPIPDYNAKNSAPNVRLF